jgi:hypothetical protein
MSGPTKHLIPEGRLQRIVVTPASRPCDPKEVQDHLLLHRVGVAPVEQPGVNQSQPSSPAYRNFLFLEPLTTAQKKKFTTNSHVKVSEQNNKPNIRAVIVFISKTEPVDYKTVVTGFPS